VSQKGKKRSNGQNGGIGGKSRGEKSLFTFATRGKAHVEEFLGRKKGGGVVSSRAYSGEGGEICIPGRKFQEATVFKLEGRGGKTCVKKNAELASRRRTGRTMGEVPSEAKGTSSPVKREGEKLKKKRKRSKGGRNRFLF